VDTEVEDEVEEDLEEVEVQYCATTANSRDIMQGKFHFHLQHVCIVVHPTMIQRISQHFWGRFKKKGNRTTIMFSGFLQKP
jgi:hypothetical protein